MAEKKKVNENNNLKILLIVGGALIVLALFGAILYKSVYNKKPEVSTIKFGDSENQVEVNRNGEVTIRTPFGIYKQKWDKEKLDRFFNKINELDFEGLGEYVGQGLAIELTYGNGIEIRVEYKEGLSDVVDELQEELEDIYEEEDEVFEFDPGSTDYYYENSRDQGYDVEVTRRDDDIEEEGEGDDGESASDDGDPWLGPTMEDVKELECSEVDPKTGKVVIISNTVCGK